MAVIATILHWFIHSYSENVHRGQYHLPLDANCMTNNVGAIRFFDLKVSYELRHDVVGLAVCQREECIWPRSRPPKRPFVWHLSTPSSWCQWWGGYWSCSCNRWDALWPLSAHGTSETLKKRTIWRQQLQTYQLKLLVKGRWHNAARRKEIFDHDQDCVQAAKSWCAWLCSNPTKRKNKSYKSRSRSVSNACGLLFVLVEDA